MKIILWIVNNENHFIEIQESFLAKPNQTQKNTLNIFQQNKQSLEEVLSLCLFR